MRIDYVGPVPPFKGGIAQHGSRLVDALRDLGNDVRVHSWRSQYPKLIYPAEQRDPAAELSPGTHYDLRWWYPISWERTGRRMRSTDLFVFPWVAPIVAPAFRLMLSVSRAPAVAIVHNPTPHRRLPGDAQLTHWVLRRLRGAVVHSEVGASELSRLVDGIRIETVGLPPTLDIQPMELPPFPPIKLLFFGLIRPYKGLDLAIEAVERLVGKGWPVELTVAGEFWEPVERWESRLAASPARHHVHLRPGYIPDAGVGAVMAAHHLIVAPYRTATQSAIVPLAHAAGRPVTATSVGGLAEAIEDGVNGTLSPPGDLEGLIHALERAMADLPRLAREASKVGITWREVAEAVLRAGAR